VACMQLPKLSHVFNRKMTSSMFVPLRGVAGVAACRTGAIYHANLGCTQYQADRLKCTRQSPATKHYRSVVELLPASNTPVERGSI
jgi:hypothetical protein